MRGVPQVKKSGRRRFLAAAGLGTGALALSGCGGSEDPYALPRPAVPGGAAWGRGQERTVGGACAQCPSGCAIQVRVVEGRVVKIDGHPDSPVNLGGIGPKGQTGLHVLYHPDRIRTPLKREGARGSGLLKPVSWEQAIDEIAAKLRELRGRGESRGLVVVDGDPRGTMARLWERFLAAYGSPNRVDHRAANDAGKVLSMQYMHGVPELPAYDWKGTQYILGFGATLFESWCQNIHLTRAASRLRRGTPGRRVKFVQISPRFSATAAKADEWIPIEPATFGALALGIGHVLVREKLVDEAFVAARTFGYERWKDAAGVEHRGFKDLLLEDWPPDRVSKVTGIPVPTIERLAREMVEHKPAVALADGGAAAATNGLGTAMAIHALNALLGNLERPGGLLLQREAPLAPWPGAEADEVAKSGAAQPRIDGAGLSPVLARSCVQALPSAILGGKPYPVQALFLHRSNPVYSKPEGARWREALAKVPLVVSFSPLPDESTLAADYVLPDSTYLEKWELVEPVPSVGHPVLTLRQPAVPPIYSTLSTGDAVIRLARAIGGSVAAAFPWPDYRKACEARLKGLLGDTAATGPNRPLADLVEVMKRQGGWWKGPTVFEDWKFPTPSGKFEFYSQALAARLKAAFPDPADLDRHLRESGVATRGDDLCMPHWEPPVFAGAPGDYPFVLALYRGINHAEGGFRHLPSLRELPMAGMTPNLEKVDLNPRDASALGVKAGEPVWVETPAARKRLVVRIARGVRPGMVAVALGHGAWPPVEGEVPAASLLVPASDPLAGILALQGTRARVRKEASR